MTGPKLQARDQLNDSGLVTRVFQLLGNEQRSLPPGVLTTFKGMAPLQRH